MQVVGVASHLDSLIDQYTTRNPRSHQLAERAKRSLPGGNTRTGVWLDPFPPYIERAQGVHLFDVDGHRLLDFAFNNSSMILGHAHPSVVEAIQQTAAHGAGCNRPTLSEIELAELLKERIPSIQSLRFCNSGTEAVFLAIRAAVAFTGKPMVAKFEGAYHGTGDHAMVSLTPPVNDAASGPAGRPRSVPSSAGLSAARDEVVVLPFNDLEACATLLRERADELAAVIIDPLMTNAGVIKPVAGFLPGLRALTEELGMLLIFDEIISYRVASGGAQGVYKIRPDLTTLGKVAAGGTAGGAFGGRADVMAQFDPTGGAKIPHNGTFNANPITMAAAIATLGLLTPAVYRRMAEQSRRVAEALREALREAGVEGSTNSVGSIFKVYFSATPPANYRETARDKKSLQRTMLFSLLNQEVHWQSGGYISAVTEESHLDQLVSAFRASLRNLS